LRNVSTISEIPRSVNNPKENSDIGGINDQSITKIKGSPIFEEEYTNSISDFDILTLIAFSASIRSNSFILKML